MRKILIVNGLHVRGKYRDVILPMTVIGRLDLGWTLLPSCQQSEKRPPPQFVGNVSPLTGLGLEGRARGFDEG